MEYEHAKQLERDLKYTSEGRGEYYTINEEEAKFLSKCVEFALNKNVGFID